MKGRVLAVLLLLAGWAAAQVDSGIMVRQLRVRVAFANGGCDAGTHVALISRGAVVSEAVANDQCEANFFNIPAGTYHLNVSGHSIADTDSGVIEMTGSGFAQYEVRVRRTGDSRSGGAPGGTFVSSADLAIPVRAQKEFDKANELIAKQDFGKAMERLNKAISIYPSYASAYNSIGVIYARQGDRDHEREALQKAIGINDHFAPAYLNLARMGIATGDFPGAETALKKAESSNPTDGTTLVLLTYSQFMNRHFDEAIATCQKAHLLSEPHSFVHQVAARAYEQKRDAVHAIAELEQFLKEEPTGPRADVARKELDEVRLIPH